MDAIVFLRQFEYLSALARERHFGRAAAACHVSQPALSTAIRKLELELGVTLVRRGHRYDDLTSDGHELLRWAQAALTAVEGLTSEASRLRHELTGTLRLGAIPTSMPAVPLVVGPFARRHPGVRIEIRTLSSDELGRRLARHELDAGLDYLDDAPLAGVEATPLYRERLMLLSSDPALDAPAGKPLEWRALAGLPLCLLMPEMRNRQIVDAALREAGVDAAPRIEADSISALLALADAGWSCVIAHTWLAGSRRGAARGRPRVHPLRKPAVTPTVGLVTPAELPPPPVRELRAMLVGGDLQARLDATVDHPVRSARASG
ncbi:MAG TPA: LysR substrate-binding domain-containing protein [Conexibacter sp.]|nr:LysR substrate-binding domain-containing protein [Conexibacter sp.]